MTKSPSESMAADAAVRGERVDAELAAPGDAGGVVALGVNAARPVVLRRALPRGDEIAVRVHGDGAVKLAAGDRGVEAELSAQGLPHAVVPPRESARAVPRTRPVPGDDEVPVR